MTQADPPAFVPFAPNFQPPPNETPNMPFPPENNKPAKPPRKKRKAAEVTQGAVQTAVSTPRQRRPRTTKTKPARTAKYDLQTILKIAGTLKEADQSAFEKLLGKLTALPKGSRERVLKALNEVFG